MHLFEVAFSKSVFFLREAVYPVHNHTYKQIYTLKNGLITHMKWFMVLCEGALLPAPQVLFSVLSNKKPGHLQSETMHMLIVKAISIVP